MRRLFSAIIFLLFFSIGSSSGAQISREAYAEMVFDILYEQNNNPNSYMASSYPNPFLDVNQNSTLGKKIILLSYLDWGGGISVIDRGPSFFPNYTLSNAEGIKMILEGYSIPLTFSANSPFNDIFPGDPYYEYFYTAWDIGMIPGGTVNPYNSLSVADAQDNITWAANSAWHPVTEFDLMQEGNYFTPNTFDPTNIGFLRGIEQGVFSHYAKNSFVIPDIKFNLNFSHYYSTQLVELPESLFPIKPLGRGWTHTYDSYITRVENAIGNDDLFYIKWPDGTIDIYNDSQNEYLTLGVYDDFDEVDNNDNIIITKKNQVQYYFNRIDNDIDILYLERIEDRNGNQINIEYETSDVDNDLRRIEYVESPSGKKLFFHYQNNTDFIEDIEDPIQRKIEFEYNEERLKYFYDAKNQETKYYYVSNDENAPEDHQYKRFLLRKVRLPKGNSIEAEYDEDNNGKLEEYTINNNDPVDIDLNIDFTSNTPIVADITVPMPGGNTQNYNYEFDENGLMTFFENDINQINIIYPSPNNNNPLLPSNVDISGLDIDYGYDDKGNVTSIQLENNEDEDFWYNDNNDLIHYRDSNNNDTYFEYNNIGNLDYIEDALGNQINFTYDNFGQVLSVTNQENISIVYTYEDDGVVSTINAPEDISASFLYDGINRMLSKIVNGLPSSYTYDPNDNLKTMTNTGGLVTSFDYDENDNMVTITNANSVNTVFTYNTEDQLTSETFGTLTKEYEYNDDGTIDKYIKPSQQTIEYDYTGDGQFNGAGTITDVDYFNDGNKKDGLIESIATDAIRYNFDYDFLNRLDEVINDDTGEEVSYQYDAVGNITRIYYPNLSLHVRYNYDEKNRLGRVQSNLNGNLETIAEYTYRADDLISEITYGNNITTHFAYDDAGRKTGIIHLDSNNDILYSENLTLNNRGNVLNSSTQYLETGDPLEDFLPSNEVQNFSYDQNNHIQSSGYNVNSDGNTTSGSGDNYLYNIDDQLIQRTTIENQFNYEYDAYGNRIKRENVTQGHSDLYVWDIVNQNIIQQGYPSTSETQNFIYGLGLEAKINSNGTIWYYHGDTRGNVVQVTDSDGLVIRDYNYDDFGLVRRVNVGHNPDHNEFTFLGKYGIIEDDRDKSLYYIRARYYDAKIGRFFTQDPIWSTNLYPYSNNNPISKFDINGKSEALALIGSIPETIGSYYGLDDFFYNNGYGDAAKILSQENPAWNFAISNPKISGLIVGFAVTGTATSVAGGITTLANLSGTVSTVGTKYAIAQGIMGLSGVYSGFTLENKLTGLFSALDDMQKNGVNINNLWIVSSNGVKILAPILIKQYDNYKPLFRK